MLTWHLCGFKSLKLGTPVLTSNKWTVTACHNIRWWLTRLFSVKYVISEQVLFPMVLKLWVFEIYRERGREREHAAGMAVAAQWIGYCIHISWLHEEHGVWHKMDTRDELLRQIVTVVRHVNNAAVLCKVTITHMKETRFSIQADGAQSPPGVECQAAFAYCIVWLFFCLLNTMRLLHFALSSLTDKAASFNVICITNLLYRVLLLFSPCK
jgi:hypothetical protein